MSITYKDDKIKNLLDSHHDTPIILFTKDGILTSSDVVTPLLSFKDILKAVNHIDAVYFNNHWITLYAHSHLTEHALLQAGFHISPVKSFLTKTLPAYQEMIIKAHHWLQWDNQSRYCGHCGHPLESTFYITEKKCTQCQQSFFPRFSPAVMVLVQKDNHILLARGPHFQKGVYSAIAGFIDIGETAEMAVHREIAEEVGLKVTNLSYIASQTWPFPDSFMIAFKATYLSGEIKIDGHELEDAQWFSLDNLPTLPNSASIAWQLIHSAF